MSWLERDLFAQDLPRTCPRLMQIAAQHLRICCIAKAKESFATPVLRTIWLGSPLELNVSGLLQHGNASD